MKSKLVRLQLSVTYETAEKLREISIQTRTPVNRLIIGMNPEVMALLKEDLEGRLAHPSYAQNDRT